MKTKVTGLWRDNGDVARRGVVSRVSCRPRGSCVGVDNVSLDMDKDMDKEVYGILAPNDDNLAEMEISGSGHTKSSSAICDFSSTIACSVLISHSQTASPGS